MVTQTHICLLCSFSLLSSATRICFLPTLPLSAGECYFNDVVTVNFKHRLFSGVSLIVNFFFFRENTIGSWIEHQRQWWPQTSKRKLSNAARKWKQTLTHTLGKQSNGHQLLLRYIRHTDINHIVRHASNGMQYNMNRRIHSQRQLEPSCHTETE